MIKFRLQAFFTFLGQKIGIFYRLIRYHLAGFWKYFKTKNKKDFFLLYISKKSVIFAFNWFRKD